MQIVNSATAIYFNMQREQDRYVNMRKKGMRKNNTNTEKTFASYLKEEVKKLEKDGK